MEQYKPAEKLELKEIKEEFPQTFKKVHCPSCDTEVPADHLSLDQGAAKCKDCNAVFSVKQMLDSLHPPKEDPMKQTLLRPEGVELFYFKDDLDITVQQNMHLIDMIGVLSFPFFAFLTVFAYIVKGTIPVAFPIVFSVFALFFIVKAILYIKAKTHIDVNDKFLRNSTKIKRDFVFHNS